MAGVGTLSMNVWPVYIGFGHTTNDDLPETRRFQIRWDTEDGMIVGHAHPQLDVGEYPCLLYFHAPTGPPSFSAQFQHPFRVTTSGRQHVGPILWDGDHITAQVN